MHTVGRPSEKSLEKFIYGVDFISNLVIMTPV